MQLQQFVFITLATAASVLLVNAQGPYPPRLAIPGAVPVPVPQPNRAQFRNEKLVRVRRPTAQRLQTTLPLIPQRLFEEPKPVTEAPEDEVPDVYLPHLLREQQLSNSQQAQFQQQAAAFFNGEPNSLQEGSIVHLLQAQEADNSPPAPQVIPTRFPERPTSARPAFNDYGIGANIASSQRFGLERQQPAPVQQQQQQQHHQQQPQQQPQRTIVRSRPALREPRPQYEAQAAPVQAPQRPRPKPIQSRPLIDQNQLQDERDAAQVRRQRPVAQTLRKWREENEDGSITWGYENDDGSFKEELIGTDCVTKGTYGYVDPDGNKREYHYETGIKCDPNTRETEEETLENNSFINYEENRAVLPNGIEIDMTQLGKKKSKRPGANYRNEA